MSAYQPMTYASMTNALIVLMLGIVIAVTALLIEILTVEKTNDNAAPTWLSCNNKSPANNYTSTPIICSTHVTHRNRSNSCPTLNKLADQLFTYEGPYVHNRAKSASTSELESHIGKGAFEIHLTPYKAHPPSYTSLSF